MALVWTNTRKKFTGIRVVRENGEPVNWISVLLRNVLRTFDEGVFLIGMIFIIVEKGEKRLGDLAAGTIVIRERISKNYLPVSTPVEKKNDLLLEAPDYELVSNFLWRRRYMLKPRRIELAKKLAEYIWVKTGKTADINETIEPGSIVRSDPEKYLEQFLT